MQIQYKIFMSPVVVGYIILENLVFYSQNQYYINKAEKDMKSAENKQSENCPVQIGENNILNYVLFLAGTKF